MKSYLWFSIQRRWISMGSLILLSLSFSITSVLMWVDHWLPHDEVVSIQWPSHLKEHLEEHESIRFVDEEADISIIYEAPSRYVIQPHKTNLPSDTLESMIRFAHQRSMLDTFSLENQIKIVMMLEPVIEQERGSSSLLSIIIISFLYFTLLGFISNLSTDVLSEKHSQALMMILSTMSKKRYFNMKLLQSLINIVFQIGLVLIGFISAVGIRVLFDQGRELLRYVYEQGWIQHRFESIISIIQLLINETSMSLSLVFSALSFFIGLLTCMLILLWLSVKATKSEELAMIQTPFYILIVIMYYASLWISEMQGLNENFGSILLHVPILSMIFHPLQLSMYAIPWWSSLVSIVVGSGFLYWIYLRSYHSFNTQNL
ncbi:MAG: hypothetical protein LRY28_00995 [Erysipelotrichaceae bacterium]|nr:hypothetical protein [Erysipelotrichaceae bacterium]